MGNMEKLNTPTSKEKGGNKPSSSFENIKKAVDKVKQAEDFGDYQRTCGEIRGLLTARQYITDLKQRMEHSDDE